jgi:hypothetical protein
VGRSLSLIVGSRWEGHFLIVLGAGGNVCLFLLLLGAGGKVYFLILLGVVGRKTNFPILLGVGVGESPSSHIVGNRSKFAFLILLEGS